MRFGVDPRAAEMKLELLGGDDGRPLLSVDSQDLLPEGLVFVAPATASYRLRVHLTTAGRRSTIEIPVGARRRAEPEDEARVAAERALSEGSRLHREDGSAERANALFTEAEARWKKAGDATGQARALSALGTSQLRHSGCSGPAERTHERALELLGQARAPDPLLEVTLRRNFAGTCLECDRPQEGLRELERALQIVRQMGDVILEARVLTDLGSGYRVVNRMPDAFARQREALALLQEWAKKHPHDPRQQDQAETLFEIGCSHHNVNGHPVPELEAASRRFEESLSLFRAAGKRHGEVRALNRLSSVAKILGNTDRALEHNLEAFELNRRYGTLRTEGYILHNRGHIHMARKERARAEEQYRAALEIRRRVGYRSGIVATLFALTDAMVLTGQLEATLPLFREALDIYDQVSGRVPDSEHRPSFSPAVWSGYRRYVRVLRRLHTRHPSRGYLAQAFEATERSRARGLLDNLTPESRQPLTLAQIQNEVLDADTLLLQYWLGTPCSLFLVSHDRLRVFDLPPEEEIESQARRVYQLLVARQEHKKFETEDEREARIQNADAEYDVEAARLSWMILAPVARYLRHDGRAGAGPRGKRLLIAAEGTLQLLPFASLPDPGALAAVRPAAAGAKPASRQQAPDAGA